MTDDLTPDEQWKIKSIIWWEYLRFEVDELIDVVFSPPDRRLGTGDEHVKEIQAMVLEDNPIHERINVRWSYINRVDHQDLALTWKALQDAYVQLLDLRMDSGGEIVWPNHTHAKAHSLAHTFKKVLGMFRRELNNYPAPFVRFVDSWFATLEEKYEQIFKVLTAGYFVVEDEQTGKTSLVFQNSFTKREKSVLLRASWDVFSREFVDVSRHTDLLLEYKAFYLHCVKKLKEHIAWQQRDSVLPRKEEKQVLEDGNDVG